MQVSFLFFRARDFLRFSQFEQGGWSSSWRGTLSSSNGCSVPENRPVVVLLPILFFRGASDRGFPSFFTEEFFFLQGGMFSLLSL